MVGVEFAQSLPLTLIGHRAAALLQRRHRCRADPSDPETAVRQSLAEAGLEVDYVERVNPRTLQPCGAETAISLAGCGGALRDDPFD